MKFSLCLSLACFLFSISAYGQQILIDSLKTKSRQPNISVEERIENLADLSFSLRRLDTEEALKIGTEALDLSRSLEDGKSAVDAWTSLYYVWRAMDSIPMVLNAIDSTMWYAKHSKNPIAMGKACFVAANYASNKDKDDDTMEYALQAIDLLKGSDRYYELASTYYTLVGMLSVKDEIQSAKLYADELRKWATESKHPEVECFSGLSSAIYYEHVYRLKDDQQALDSSQYYLKRTIDIFEKNRDVINGQFIGGNVILNYASSLWKEDPDISKDIIIDLLEKGIQWATEANDNGVIATCYAFMTEFYIKEKRYVEAERILLGTLATLEQNKANASSIHNITSALLRMAERWGDKDRIIKYQKLDHDNYRKIYDAKQTSTIKTLEATYNHKKKEIELANLRQQSEFNKKVTIRGSILVLLFLLLIVVYFRMRIKSTAQKNELLEAQTNEALLQKQLKEEEALRQEKEQLLVKQHNQQLQKEIFARVVQLQQKNELLRTVRDEVSAEGNKNGQVDKIIQESFQSDDYFEEYKFLIKEVHPNFFNRLQEHAKGKLSELDLKYCTYIYMNIPSKQMATMLHVEYNTIRMNKYRLKQKLQLNKEDDLELYIKSIN